MSKVRKFWLVWRCSKCNRSHKFNTYGVAQCDKQYVFERECDKCRKVNEIAINLGTCIKI